MSMLASWSDTLLTMRQARNTLKQKHPKKEPQSLVDAGVSESCEFSLFFIHLISITKHPQTEASPKDKIFAHCEAQRLTVRHAEQLAKVDSH